MSLQELASLDHILTRYVLPFGSHIIGAFAVWFIGGVAVKALQKVLVIALEQKRVDPTLVSYAHASVGVIFRIFLLLAILGIFGLETTSFSALLAAAGVAIGVAWSGLLSNFAAGIFLILLRPFKVGDLIFAAGVTGVVREIGLFATAIDNGENLRVFVGNNKLFAENILNYSTNPTRIATFRVQLPQNVDPTHAIQKITDRLQSISSIGKSNVLGEINEFNVAGTVITFRVSCDVHAYPLVMAQGNELIYQTLHS